MKIFFLLIGLLAMVYAAKRIPISPRTDNMDAIQLQKRADYLKKLDESITSEVDNVNKFKALIKHTVVNALEIRNLDVSLAVETPSGVYADPPNFSVNNDDTSTYLSVVYAVEDLIEKFGCKEMPENPTYVGKVCKFKLDYIASELDVVLSTIDFSISVKLPKSASSTATIKAVKLYRNLCDCDILTGYPLLVDIYSDPACTTPLLGTTLKYGDTICMKVTTINPIASTYNFKSTSVLMTNKNSLGSPVTTELMPVSSVTCKKGECQVVLDVLAVGDISYTNTIVLSGARRMLDGNGRVLSDISDGKGLQGTSLTYTITGGPVTNSGSMIKFSIGVLLALFALFFI